MVINSRSFGGITLTGDDAKAFHRQIAERAEGWPKVRVENQFNLMAACSGCHRDATQTRISFYCIDAINGGPYLCDECRQQEADDGSE